MNGTCRTCRWWTANPAATSSRCELLGTTQGMARPENPDGPTARTTSGSAWFWTPATFGCRLWAERRV